MAIHTAYQNPSIDHPKRISMRSIRALATKIARQFNPDQIILFGSYAYGKPTIWSDVDFLVVVDSDKGELDTALEISAALPKLAFRVDIITRSRVELEKRKKLGDWFLIDVTEKGKVLYERLDSRVG